MSVGERVLRDLTDRTKIPCGFATIANLLTSQREDRMESFFLSETLKVCAWPSDVNPRNADTCPGQHQYLFLLFDEDNPLHSLDSNFVFTTEGHVLQLQGTTRQEAPVVVTPHDPDHQLLSTTPQPTCPRHRLSTLRSGLVGSIRDRADYEYARHLVGIHLDSAEAQSDSHLWDIYGICDVAQTEVFVSSSDSLASSRQTDRPLIESDERVRAYSTRDDFL